LFIRRVQGAAARVTPSEDSDMSAKDVDAEIPSAQNFHPEFGYLCPSAQMRRRVRRAALTVLAGMAVAAGTALALVPQLVPQPAGDYPREQSALSVAAALPSIDQAADEAKAKAKAPEGKPAATAPSATVTERSVSARAQTSCDDLSGYFLAPKCRFGKAGKARMMRSARSARAARHQVATIPIGRAEAPLQVEQQRVEQPRATGSGPAPAAETAPAAVATNTDPAVPPLEKPASAKKPVKTAHKQAPRRDVASADTMASARAPEFGLFGPFHEPSHGGNGSTGSRAWAMSW
jgi:hypothetical protein